MATCTAEWVALFKICTAPLQWSIQGTLTNHTATKTHNKTMRTHEKTQKNTFSIDHAVRHSEGTEWKIIFEKASSSDRH